MELAKHLGRVGYEVTRQTGSHIRLLGRKNATPSRIFLLELDRLATARTSFAFETTLSGHAYVKRLAKWKALGYRIEIAYLKIDSPQLALKRIAARVRQAGHNVARDDVLRRFGRSRANFERLYRSLADAWWVYDNSGIIPKLLEHGP
jgi:predicted ABC-type ATPase